MSEYLVIPTRDLHKGPIHLIKQAIFHLGEIARDIEPHEPPHEDSDEMKLLIHDQNWMNEALEVVEEHEILMGRMERPKPRQPEPYDDIPY